MPLYVWGRNSVSYISTLALHWGVWKISTDTPSHAVQTLQVMLKTVKKEGYFSREAENFCLCISPLHFSGVSEIRHMVLPPHETRAVSLGWNPSLRKAERVLRPYLLWHCSGVTEKCDITLPAHGLQAVNVTLKSVINEWHFTLQAETVFRPCLPLELQWGNWNFPHGTPCVCVSNFAS
jgi:hypothetical protein